MDLLKQIRMLIALLVLACLLGAEPARAENPRITLRVQEVSLDAVLRELQRVSFVRLRNAAPRPSPGATPPRPAPWLERASFDWRDVPLSRALREVAARFGVAPVGGGDELQFYPRSVRAAGPEPRPVRQGEVNLTVVGLQRYEQFTRRLLDPDAAGSRNASSHAVTLRVHWEDGDASDLAGIANVRATDGNGRTVTGTAAAGYFFGGFPDETQFQLSFPALTAGTTKLAVVEGELLRYPPRRRRRLQVPVPLAEAVVQVPVEPDLLFAVSRFREEEFAVEENTAVGTPEGNAFTSHRFTLRARTYQRNNAAERWAWKGRGGGRQRTGDLQPYLKGASGRLYPWSNSEGAGYSDAIWGEVDYALTFTDIPEPVVAVIWDLEERPQPQRWMRFKLQNLILPSPASAAAAPVYVTLPPPPEGNGAAPAPYHQPGGGGLRFAVSPPPGSFPGGSVLLGLGRQTAQDYDLLSWTEVAVGAEGTVTLPDLAPGRYRVVRAYRDGPNPDGRSTTRLPGHWRNAVVEVTVRTGEKTALLPLRWEGQK